MLLLNRIYGIVEHLWMLWARGLVVGPSGTVECWPMNHEWYHMITVHKIRPMIRKRHYSQAKKKGWQWPFDNRHAQRAMETKPSCNPKWGFSCLVITAVMVVSLDSRCLSGVGGDHHDCCTGPYNHFFYLDHDLVLCFLRIQLKEKIND